MNISDLDLSLLKTGDVFCCSGDRTPLSTGIKIGSLSDLTHTSTFKWLYYSPTGQPRPYMSDAQRQGFYDKPLEWWLNKYGYKFFVMRAPEEINAEEFLLHAETILGTPYDIFNLIFRQPQKILTGKWKDKKDEMDRIICNGGTAYMQNYRKMLFPNPDMYDPQQIFERMLKLKYDMIPINNYG